MKTLTVHVAIVTLLAVFVSACGGNGSRSAERIVRDIPSENAANSRSDNEIEQIENMVRGRQILFSWRDGEAVYGTYYFTKIHHYNSNGFLLDGMSEKSTVLDNVQRRT